MAKEKNSNIPHNDLVAKSNDFALGIFDDRYTALMRDILATAISKVNTDDKELKPIIIPVEEFINIDDGKGIARLRKARKELLRAIVEYTQPDGGWEGKTVFAKLTWEPGTATLTCLFNTEVRPELIQLQKYGHFTQYRLSMYRQMRSKYAKDLYEKLSVWLRNYRQHKYNLDELHTLLNTPKYAQKEFWQFRDKILDPAVAEINDKTDWTIEYKTEKMRLYDKKTGKRRMKTSNIIFIRTDDNAPSGYEMVKSENDIDAPDPEQVSMFAEDGVNV